MTDYSGFIFIIDEPQRAEEIQGLVTREHEFTDVLSTRDWPLEKREVFLLSLEPDVLTHAALVDRGLGVATSKRRIKLRPLVSFSPPIHFNELKRDGDLNLDAFFARSSTGVGKRIDPETWLKLLKMLREVRPTTSNAIDQLLELLAPPPLDTDQDGFLSMAEQRDTVNLAMRIARFDHTSLETVPLPARSTPFLEIPSPLAQREDKMIDHDAHVRVFGDLDNTGSRQGGQIFFEKGNERLIVMNVNRHPIETTLGVDLLYYQQRYHSYVMVQYKRMKKVPGDWIFRISASDKDDSYKAEFKRMRDCRGYLAAQNEGTGEIDDFRLHTGLFHFKLCRSEVQDWTSADMIDGIYLPLDYWEELLRSERVIGPHKGIRVAESSIGRKYSNTLFIDLVRNGWIGSRCLHTDEISKIINEVLESGRSLTLAAHLNTR